jgi:ATP-dependent DNA helicase RecG
MTVDDLRRPHESKPRNKLIANAFFLIKYVEQFGTGIQRILDDCRAQDLPSPAFEAKGYTFRAIFLPRRMSSKSTAAPNLTERQKKMVVVLKQMGRITRSEYENHAGVSRATAKRDLENLKKWGIVVQRESGPTAYYELSDKPEKKDEPM